jgi:hypothetical protein
MQGSPVGNVCDNSNGVRGEDFAPATSWSCSPACRRDADVCFVSYQNVYLVGSLCVRTSMDQCLDACIVMFAGGASVWHLIC